MSRQGHLFHHSGIEHMTVKQMTCGTHVKMPRNGEMTPALDIVIHVTYLDAVQRHRPMIRLGRGWMKTGREQWEAAEW
jgi:hypothetical protein